MQEEFFSRKIGLENVMLGLKFDAWPFKAQATRESNIFTMWKLLKLL